MKNLILIVSILISTIAYAQKEDKKAYEKEQSNNTIFTKASAGDTKTISINVKGYHPNIVGEFKDELIGFRYKILSVDFDEAAQIVSIHYNEHMLKQDFIHVFKKYTISYTKEVENN